MGHALKWGSMPLEDKHKRSVWKNIPNKKNLMLAIFKNSKVHLVRKFLSNQKGKSKRMFTCKMSFLNTFNSPASSSKRWAFQRPFNTNPVRPRVGFPETFKLPASSSKGLWSRTASLALSNSSAFSKVLALLLLFQFVSNIHQRPRVH